MHVDNVTMMANGTMTVTLSEFFNPTVAASFAGATVAGSVVTADGIGGQIALSVTVTPSAPVVQQSAQPDPGGSATIDG